MSETVADTLGALPQTRHSAEAEKPKLGDYLAKARESRGCSRDDAVKQTRIPEHYLLMLESNDYSSIADQLYVLPFLRRYAVFLDLDEDEMAMRFVREVQRADNATSARSLQPIMMDRPKKNRWVVPALAAGLIGVIAIAWLAQSRHSHRVASDTSVAHGEKTASGQE